MKRTLLLLLAALGVAAAPARAARPRLIVQIVVGSLRAEDMARFADNFGEGGFRRLTDGGLCFTDSRYDYQQTTTPVSLATLTTGAQPAMHGVVGYRWRDYVENKPVDLVLGRAGIGPYNLIAPTLAETLVHHAEGSRVVTVAGEAASAVVMAGRGGEAFWLDEAHGGWTTSAYYVPVLPDWIARINRERYNLSYIASGWRLLYDAGRYRNTLRRDYAISSAASSRSGRAATGSALLDRQRDYDRLLGTPAGNAAVLGFAKQLIAQYRLGDDETPDLLNICLDASCRVVETYGPESVEAEDMYYRLDRDLADFLTYLFAQVRDGEALVVLTAAHGTSPSYDLGGEDAERFNTRQFEVIVNGFLNARYGMGDWVLEYEDKSLYLNHNLIYERGLTLAEVQNEAAIFAMQFRGVSHAMAATTMRTSYFGSGYARMMQNGFYPRRSGDVVLNLMPGWIEEREGCVSLSGSMYGYDTCVPLIFYGTGVAAGEVARRVEMTSVAPTLARIAGISAPAASEGTVLGELTD